MIKLIGWVKTHKAIVLLLAVIGFLLFKYFTPRAYLLSNSTVAPSNNFGTMEAQSDARGGSTGIAKMMPIQPYPQAVPPSDSAVRMISTDTSLSLKVDNVAMTVERIGQTTTTLGGYLIDSNISVPEGASSGSINVRVPSEKRAEALAAFKAQGVKTVSEYVVGQDVTDQFVDNDEKLRILESTKTKFEAILADAKNVTEMLNVQQQLLSLQQQIDTIKGQQKYLEGTAKYSRISVYLSTDELSLPYAPVTSWRPQVIFKEAVRSLMLNARALGTLLIWIAVYSPVVIIIALIAWLLYRRMKNR
ncbi:MAG: DUF4349 domain-containing protein [Candidatus Woesebacteria bacterium]